MNHAESSHSLLSLLSAISGLVLSAARSRLGLIAEDLRIEKQRCVRALLLLGGGVLCATLASAFLCLAIVLLVPITYRGLAAAAVGVFYALVAVLCLVRGRRRAGAPPFQQSIDRLKKDAEYFDVR